MAIPVENFTYQLGTRSMQFFSKEDVLQGISCLFACIGCSFMPSRDVMGFIVVHSMYAMLSDE